MAIRPEISLAVQQANVAPAISTFLNVRNAQQQAALQPLRQQLLEQRMEGAGLQNELTRFGIQTEKDAQDLRSVAQFATQHQSVFEDGDPTTLLPTLDARIATIQRQGGDPAQSIELREAIKSTPEQSRNMALGAIKLSGLLPQQVSTKAFAPVTDPATGQVSIPTFDPNTGQASFQPVQGLIQETPEQKREAELKTATVKKAGELKAKRTSDITKELGDRNRSAARAQRPLKQALKLVAKADQGLTGAAKLQLSRLLPGVDASDEAVLSATLNQLALEQLQQFKGPTTDFEFGITQNIAGTLGQSREANEARVKSLDRNNWFNQREFKQFNQHIKSGGDPDSFAFNFGEPVKTKKGVFTLQDVQDTAVANNLTIEETLKRLNQ